MRRVIALGCLCLLAGGAWLARPKPVVMTFAIDRCNVAWRPVATPLPPHSGFVPEVFTVHVMAPVDAAKIVDGGHVIATVRAGQERSWACFNPPVGACHRGDRRPCV